MEWYEPTQRPLRADSMRSRCARRNSYLENGFIRPITGSVPEDYNPFDFYKTGEKDTESLHREFANINLSDDKDILRFYNKYGALGLFRHEYCRIVALPITESKYDQKDRMSNVYAVDRISDYLTPIDEIIARYGVDKSIIPSIDDNGMFEDKNGYLTNFEIEACYTSENINDFKSICSEYKALLDLKCALDGKDYDAIRELLVLYSKTYESYVNDRSNEGLLSLAASAIISEVSTHVEGMATPQLQWSQDGTGISNEITWRCDTLLSAIYLMLFLDIINSNQTRKCVECQRYFEANPTKKNNIYCSSSCRNRANTRNYREIQKSMGV